MNPASVSTIATTINLGIAVQSLTPPSVARKAYSIVPMWHRCKIENGKHLPGAVSVLTHKGNYTGFPVLTIDPKEAMCIKISLP